MTFNDITTNEQTTFDDLEVSKSLPWHGILNEQDLQRLRESFGEVILIPDLKMRLARIDVDGKIMLPGCSTGFSEARRLMKAWAARLKDDESHGDWWLELIAKKGITPIKIADLLDGLDSKIWKEYKQVHRLALAKDRTKRSREGKKRKAIEAVVKMRKERKVAAVEALMDLTRAS